MLDLIFVYGTLRSTFDNEYARLLRADSLFLGPAAVRGAVRHSAGYPAFLPEPDGEVVGELYRMKNPEATLARLDEYEGDGYERTVVSASAGTGNFEAWIYSRPQRA